jgi:copper(I)-binding protein
MRPLNLLLLFSLFIFNVNPAQAHEYKAGDLEIVHPWARAQLKGSDVADGFMKIVNHGSTPDRLTAVSVDFAKSGQIHDMKMEGSVMKMEEMKDGLEIPPGGTVELKPNSMHIMFVGMKKELVPDEMVDGELTFEKAGKVKVKFTVEPAGTDHAMDNM